MLLEIKKKIKTKKQRERENMQHMQHESRIDIFDPLRRTQGHINNSD